MNDPRRRGGNRSSGQDPAYSPLRGVETHREPSGRSASHARGAPTGTDGQAREPARASSRAADQRFACDPALLPEIAAWLDIPAHAVEERAARLRVVGPLLRRYLLAVHLLESVALEERLDAIRGGACEHVRKAVFGRALESKAHEVTAYTLSDKTREGVDLADIAESRNSVRHQGTDSGEVASLDEDPEGIGKDRFELVRRALHEVALDDAALDQPVGGVELVEG